MMMDNAGAEVGPMDYQWTYEEHPQDKRRALILALLLWLLLIATLGIPIVSSYLDMPEFNTVEVAFESASSAASASSVAAAAAPTSEAKVEPEPTPPPPATKATPVIVEEKKEVVIAEKAEPKQKAKPQPSAAEVQAKAEAEAAAKAAREAAEREKQAEAARQAEAERRAEAARQAEAERQRKEKAYQASKSAFANALNNASSRPVSQGSSAGSGASSSSSGRADAGDASQGLDGRSVEYAPHVTDNSQKVGRVVVYLCVDRTGKVTSAKYTQRGSTTVDSDLVQRSLDAARKYRFSSSTRAEQCGTISFDYKVE